MKAEAPTPVPAPIIQSDGSLDEQVLSEQYGLSREEALQTVTFGTYAGTVAQMLDDTRCPVGGMIRKAYKDNGINGVTQQFQILSSMDQNFKVEIAQETIQRNHKKKELNNPVGVQPDAPSIHQATPTVSVEEKKQKSQKTTSNTVRTRSYTIKEDKHAPKPESETLSTIKVYEAKLERVLKPADYKRPISKIIETNSRRENTSAASDTAEVPLAASIRIQPASTEAVRRQTEQMRENKRNHIVFEQLAQTKTHDHSFPPDDVQKLHLDAIASTEARPTQTKKNELQVKTLSTIETIDQTSLQEAMKEFAPETGVIIEKNKIVIGIQGMQTEGHKEKTESAELTPITAVGELAKALEYIDSFILNDQLHEELFGEALKQAAPEIVVFISQEMLELIEFIVEKPNHHEIQGKDEQLKNRQIITFSTHGENKKEISIEGKHLLAIRSLLHILDVKREQSQAFLIQIDSLVKKVEARTNRETPALILTVSDELLTFIETGGEILRKMTKNNYEWKQAKSVLITVNSADKKVTTDMTTLKKLMKILKKKQQIDRHANVLDMQAAPEEIKTSLPYQNVITTSFWPFYKALIFLLTLLGNQDDTDDYGLGDLPQPKRVLFDAYMFTASH